MIASRALLHPIVLGAMALLVINDHVLKSAAPGLVTGKLSDLCGMIFFPLLLSAAAEQLGVRRGMKTIVVASIATAVVFTSIKLWAPAGDVYRFALAALQWPFRAAARLLAGDEIPALAHVSLVADPTDLVALVAIAVPMWLVLRPTSSLARAATTTPPPMTTPMPTAAGTLTALR